MKRKAGGNEVPAQAGNGSGTDGLAAGLAKLGARILRFEGGTVSRYELELPASRLSDLEAFLRGRGDLIPSSRPKPGRDAVPTLRLVLRVEPAP
jgi:hypothetical protein